MPSRSLDIRRFNQGTHNLSRSIPILNRVILPSRERVSQIRHMEVIPRRDTAKLVTARRLARPAANFPAARNGCSNANWRAPGPGCWSLES